MVNKPGAVPPRDSERESDRACPGARSTTRRAMPGEHWGLASGTL
jgi:hypothetical protein